MTTVRNVMIHCNASDCAYKREDNTCRAPVTIQIQMVVQELEVFYDNRGECKHRVPVGKVDQDRLDLLEAVRELDKLDNSDSSKHSEFCPCCGEEYPEALKQESA